jgi:hypothetical protein
MVELHLHSPIRLHGVVLNYVYLTINIIITSCIRWTDFYSGK